MNGFKNIFLLLLTLSFVMGGLYSTGWAGDKFSKDDPVAHGWSAVDLLVARPLGIVAGLVGTTIFVAALPFTIPSGNVGNAADMFIAQPFQFSFTRKIPDEVMNSN
jgi:hypothetical protein